MNSTTLLRERLEKEKMSKTIYFVTTNSRKVEEFQGAIGKKGNRILQHNFELIEPQVVDSFEIIQHKLDQAMSILPGKRVLVDDRGFNILALNGFPGPMLKLVLKTIGVKGLGKLMSGEVDRRAQFVTSIGYYDGRDKHYLYYEEQGFLVSKPQGDNLRGWTELLHLYGHSLFPGRSLAELTDDEWGQYLAFLAEQDALSQLQPIL